MNCFLGDISYLSHLKRACWWASVDTVIVLHSYKFTAHTQDIISSSRIFTKTVVDIEPKSCSRMHDVCLAHLNNAKDTLITVSHQRVEEAVPAHKNKKRKGIWKKCRKWERHQRPSISNTTGQAGLWDLTSFSVNSLLRSCQQEVPLQHAALSIKVLLQHWGPLEQSFITTPCPPLS